MQAGLYRHHKGGLYQLIGIGEHTETGEKMVVYVSLAELPGSRLRIRPLNGPEGWNTPIQSSRKRFVFVGEGLPDATAK